jgi:outer membrane protein OmpA-like peptidoglycan-associated protein
VKTAKDLIAASTLMLAAGLLPLAPAAAFSQSGSALVFGAEKLTLSESPLSFASAPVQTETATTIEVTLPADVLFDFDRADIRATAQRALHEVAEMIRSKAGGPVTIQGYTDALGKDAYNQALSERRANAVKTWLATKESLPVARFTTAGFGPRNPVAPNQKPDGSDDADGRQLNRRVTLIIRK